MTKKRRDTADSLSTFTAVRNQTDVDKVVCYKSNVVTLILQS